MITCENNYFFIGLEEEQEKGSIDLRVCAVQDSGSNHPACQRPYSAQLDPLSFISLLIYT